MMYFNQEERKENQQQLRFNKSVPRQAQPLGKRIRKVKQEAVPKKTRVRTIYERQERKLLQSQMKVQHDEDLVEYGRVPPEHFISSEQKDPTPTPKVDTDLTEGKQKAQCPKCNRRSPQIRDLKNHLLASHNLI
jgi:hypothetical protein